MSHASFNGTRDVLWSLVRKRNIHIKMNLSVLFSKQPLDHHGGGEDIPMGFASFPPKRNLVLWIYKQTENDRLFFLINAEKNR